ncbi:hypothetical protein [Microbacterium sp. LWH11-1.2]|uniref:hypothetical protein n=1 Tax=Microbacterium sp. LWH11-1.2 TaxID=3135258 RepID=UPI0031392B9D
MERAFDQPGRKKRVAARVGLTLLGLVLLWFALTLLPLLGSDPGAPQLSWADKLTALGTVGAVVATLAITLTTYFRDRKSRQTEARERAEFQLKQQALQVHWWLEPCPDHVPEWVGEDYGMGWLMSRSLDECWGSRLVLENRSELPIHDVSPVMTLRIVLRPQFGNWSIGPGGRSTFHLSGEGECLLDMVHAPRPYLLFRDHTGRAWRRDENGTISLVDPETDLSDEMISLSGEAYRTLHANDRLQVGQRRAREEILRVLSPLVAAGLDTVPLEKVWIADEVAFNLLQRFRRGNPERRVGNAWWSWRARSESSDRLEEALRYLV